MTAGGSFFATDNEPPARGSQRDARLRSCGLCMQAGFASIAVIPVRCGEQTIGAFHMADERPGHVSAKTVEFVESFASMVGEAIRRFDADEELRRHHDHLVERMELTDAALHASQEKFQGMVEIAQAASGEDRIEGLVYSGMISRHPQMLECLAAVRRLASAPVPVLVRGASGTGKELVARALHDSGVRRDKPYVVVNCAAVPEALLEAELFGIEKGTATGVLERTGKLELADGGTVFLDEIGDMEPALQAKLLRFLQDEVVEKVGGGPPTKVDVRVVAATNQNLEDKMQQGAFRRDLYYRLNTVELLLPPLSGRTADIRDFVFYFIKRSNREYGRNIKGIADLALHRLVTYDWPGNVRQLEHAVERAVLMTEGDSIELKDLPHDLQQLPTPEPGEIPGSIRATREAIHRRITADVEKQMVLDCLDRASWCVVRAAKMAGFSRYHLHRLMRKHNISRPRKGQSESTQP
jgi:transcriptional regulator with GAF, ATPase, and Fis domain